MSGWGAACKVAVPVSSFFLQENKGSHINEIELSAALLALHKYLPLARRRHVLPVTDSFVTAHVVRNYTSLSPLLLSKLRLLYCSAR